MPFSAASAAGVAALQMSIVNLNGVPSGLSGVLADVTPVGMHLMRFTQKYGGVVPSPVFVEAKGDNNRNIHQYVFNPSTLSNLQMTFQALDMDAFSAFQATKKFTIAGKYGVGVQPNTSANQAQGCMVVNMDAEIADPDGTFGEKRFLNEVIPLVTIYPMSGNRQEVQAVGWEYQGRPTQSGKLPWGTPYSLATNGFTVLTLTAKTITFAALSAGDTVVVLSEAIDLIASL